MNSVPKNEWRHRQARKAAGLTPCTACRGSGYINYSLGSGVSGLYSCRMESLKCVCRCVDTACEEDAEENGWCSVHDSDVDEILADALRQLLKDSRE